MGGLAVSDVWLLTRTDGLSCHYGGIVNAGSRACVKSTPHAANRVTGFVHQRSTEGVDLGGQLSASVAGVNDAARLQQSTAVSTSALGQCSAPRGMTKAPVA